MGNTLAAAELGCVCGISRTASRTLELFFEAGGHARLPLSEFVADYESREEVCGTTAVSSNRAASFSERWEGAASRRGQHDQLARVTVRKATTPVREVSTRTFERVFPRILFDFNCVNHDASRLHRHSDDMATQFHLEQFRAPLQHVVKTPPWWHCSLDFPSGSCAVSLCFANFSSHSTFLSVDVCSVLVHAVDRRRKTRLDRRSDESARKTLSLCSGITVFSDVAPSLHRSLQPHRTAKERCSATSLCHHHNSPRHLHSAGRQLHLPLSRYERSSSHDRDDQRDAHASEDGDKEDDDDDDGDLRGCEGPGGSHGWLCGDGEYWPCGLVDWSADRSRRC
ncbi:hypothetical protein BC567DRAFT_4694 [Phyllosticta citribraziliensis]